MTFKGKLVAGLVGASALLVTVALLSYVTVRRSAEDRKWVAHTEEAIEELTMLRTNMTEAETYERGYIISGDDSYLPRFRQSVESVQEGLAAGRQLMSDNPEQVRAFTALDPLVAAKLKYLERRNELRSAQGKKAAMQEVSEGPGKELMGEIDAILEAMKQRELVLLAKRSRDLQESAENTKLVIVLGDSLGCVFLAGAGLAIRREMGQRSRVEDEIRKLNIELERRVAERTAELAERAKDLERSNQELQQFAYVASHDLQEPLRTISSFTQLLAKRYSDRLDDRAREFINFAVDGCKRMQTLINDLLTFSRVGTQGKPLAHTDIGAVLERVLSGMKIAVQESGAVITRGPLPVVLADEVQLGQLFQNLIGNGLKFRSGQTPRIHVGAERTGKEWKIVVRDNGIGVAPEHKDRIFVIFQRLHTATQYPGTGIGLAICKKIAERHGGRIWVEAPAEGGSAFYFTIADGGQNAKEGEEDELRIHTAAD